MSYSYDQPIVDVAHYVYHYEISVTDTMVWERAQLALLDALGCAIETMAVSSECRKLLGPTVPGTFVPHGVRIPGTSLQVDPVEGAFAIGALIRYLDHNDALGGREWGHPSDNLAAILAVLDWRSRTASSGESTHVGPPLTMRTLLIALVKAYEIQGCYQMQNAFNAYGIDHVVLVKLASAAVVSWLLGLTEEQAMASISHVWMDGQPTRVYRSRGNTTPRKGWAAADAARRAVQLALYVQAGQPGSPQALTAKPWGFLSQTFGPDGFVFPQPFETWTIRNMLFKTMPVEGHGVSAVEVALLQRRHLAEKGWDPMQHIKRIDLHTTAAADLIINKIGLLQNAADRDHCIQYVVALAFLKGSAPEAEDYLHDSTWATSEDLSSLRDRINVTPDSGLTQDYLDLKKKSIGARMTVLLNDGSMLPEILIEYPIGHARHPNTKTAVYAKFRRNMARMFSEAETIQIEDLVRDGDLPVKDFVDLLARPKVQSKL